MKKLISFTKKSSQDLQQNCRQLSTCSRITNFLKEGILSLTDYHDGKHYSAVTDLTSQAVAYKIYQKMKVHPTGERILQEKPRITDEFYEALSTLPDNTFGF